MYLDNFFTFKKSFSKLEYSRLDRANCAKGKNEFLVM